MFAKYCRTLALSSQVLGRRDVGMLCACGIFYLSTGKASPYEAIDVKKSKNGSGSLSSPMNRPKLCLEVEDQMLAFFASFLPRSNRLFEPTRKHLITPASSFHTPAHRRPLIPVSSFPPPPPLPQRKKKLTSFSCRLSPFQQPSSLWAMPPKRPKKMSNFPR